MGVIPLGEAFAARFRGTDQGCPAGRAADGQGPPPVACGQEHGASLTGSPSSSSSTTAPGDSSTPRSSAGGSLRSDDGVQTPTKEASIASAGDDDGSASGERLEDCGCAAWGASQPGSDGTPAVLSAGRWSSGVVFYPPSERFWRIGGRWYDFEPFLERHPGGPQALLVARDRFEDCTFVFEAHHHNYRRARAVIQQYEVPEGVVAAHGLRRRPRRGESEAQPAVHGAAHHDQHLDAGLHARLLDDDAFYSVLRRRVADHLRKVGYPDGGPTLGCQALFWAVFAMWAATWAGCWLHGSFVVAALCGLASTWLGAFGHNWVHQPKYRLWAHLSLDVIGLNSQAWFRDHNLQHHMYTNTPWDNHFEGTAPFLVTDPTVQRNLLQAWVTPYINSVLLAFGIPVNYIANTVELLKGNEVLSAWKLFYPLQWMLLIWRWGVIRGALLQFTVTGIVGVYYFTLALMNHNSEHGHDIASRNASKDWGEAQIHTCADWAVDASFLSSWRFLWLNRHTVHHLFPRTDFSHHAAMHGILMRTCDEFGIDHQSGEFWALYRQLLKTLAESLSPMKEVLVYAGGV